MQFFPLIIPRPGCLTQRQSRSWLLARVYGHRKTILACKALPYFVKKIFLLPSIPDNKSFISYWSPWVHPESPWGHLGSPWGHPGVILGHPVVILGHPGVILGYEGVILRSSWIILGSSWVSLGSSWGHLGSLWGHPELFKMSPLRHGLVTINCK